MKERVKKFYNDNKETLISVGVAAAGIAVYTLGISMLIADRHRIQSVASLTCDEGVLHVKVVKQNGKTSDWDWHTQ